MRVVFLGTPDFAVESLQAVYDAGHEILAVVTQPDKERNRGVVSFCPVKQRAVELGLRVLQFNKIRNEGEEILRELAPDIMITCAYGQIISQSIIDIPKYGIINVHASLLPKFRGSSPIQWAILTGQTKTGVSIMRTALGIDSGDILLQKIIDILPEETAGELFDRLSELGAKALIEGLEIIQSGNAVYTPQDPSQATHYPMLSREDGKIDWHKSAKEIGWHIRGMNPWPSAFSYIGNKMFKVWKAYPIQDMSEMDKLKAGQIWTDGKSMIVKCGKGCLQLAEVQLEGKKRMDTKSFLLGNKLNIGDKLD